MSMLNIVVEDHVVPQLLTSALEAYEVEHPSGRQRLDKLETFGLLWGYVIPGRRERNPFLVVTAATVETSALRKSDSVAPNLGSLRMKAEFIGRYWPHLEVVGTFHSHPYDSLKDARACRGWQASSPKTNQDGGDTIYWPLIHKELSIGTPYLGHLIVTVTSLKKAGWAQPKRFCGNSGYELSMGTRKLWITSYATEIPGERRRSDGRRVIDDREAAPKPVMMASQPFLDIPSITMRALKAGDEAGPPSGLPQPPH